MVKRDWGFLMIQQGGATLKLEYINKEEGEAARNILAKGESYGFRVITSGWRFLATSGSRLGS
jgi:hypothetical protein